MSQHSRVIHLYKTLLHLGKEYPTGSENFRSKLKTAFSRNAHLRDPAEIETAISRGAFVVKEIEALYMLRKYRAMKNRYYKD